jgi:chitinase
MKLLPLCMGLTMAITAQAAELVVGYYPSWTRNTTPAAKVRYQDLTTIAHSFIWPKSDGSVDMYSDLLYPDLITRAHAAKVKVIVSIGGWGQCDGFAPMAANASTRKIFIDNVVAFLQKNGYDGIDLDWEYPSGSAQRSNFSLLATEFRKAFDAVNKAWTISFVVPSGQNSESSFNYAVLRDIISWIGCMTYDMHGSWTRHAGHNSPLYAPANEPEGSIDTAIKYLLGFGIEKSKLLIGVPFYGHQFAASKLYGPATGGAEITYTKIMAAVKPDWTYQWDDVAKVPYYQDGARTTFITFDDTVSVRYKCDYVRSSKLGGLIIWALGQDDLGTKQPPSQTIGDRLTRNSTTVETPVHDSQPGEFDLLSCYPNPSNSSTRVRFYLEAAGEITLRLYDICGRQLELIAAGHHDAGWHEILLSGDGLATGIYRIRLAGPNRILSAKFTLIR